MLPRTFCSRIRWQCALLGQYDGVWKIAAPKQPRPEPMRRRPPRHRIYRREVGTINAAPLPWAARMECTRRLSSTDGRAAREQQRRRRRRMAAERPTPPPRQAAARHRPAPTCRLPPSCASVRCRHQLGSSSGAPGGSNRHHCWQANQPPSRHHDVACPRACRLAGQRSGSLAPGQDEAASGAPATAASRRRPLPGDA